MNCMKCGRETEQNQIFCRECLAVMDQYPVKPGTVVQIPTQPPKKQTHHRRVILSSEEQIRKLTKRVHILALVLALTIALTILLGIFAVEILGRSQTENHLGQNYSVITQTEEPTGPPVTGVGSTLH